MVSRTILGPQDPAVSRHMPLSPDADDFVEKGDL